MYRGKRTCKILKEIRAQIAAENDIEFVTSECKHQGDCAGTCPKCEAEVRYLEKELEKRVKLGKAVTVAGLAAAITATSISATSCDAFRPTGGEPTESYVDTTDGQNVKLSTFTPNYVAKLSKSARLPQLQNVLESKPYGFVSDRYQLLSFWEDYFVGFDQNTDYYRLYHPEDENVQASRQKRLLAVTYTADGSIEAVTATDKKNAITLPSSPAALNTIQDNSLLVALLRLTKRNKENEGVNIRDLIRYDLWAEHYLGTHEWLDDADMYRISEDQTFWILYFDNSTEIRYAKSTRIEEIYEYPDLVFSSITPQVLANQQKIPDAAAFLNDIFINRISVQEEVFKRWSISSADYYIGADSATVQYYSLTPVNDEMRKNHVEVDALAITFNSSGWALKVHPVKLHVNEKDVLLPLDTYFSMTTSVGKIKDLVLRSMQYSPLSPKEDTAALKKLWQSAWKREQEGAHYYSVTSDSYKSTYGLWAFFTEDGILSDLTAYRQLTPPDDDEVLGGDSPTESFVDPWDATPRDE